MKYEKNSRHLVGISDMRRYLCLPERDGLADDIVITKVEVGEDLPLFRYPCRFDGFVAVLCLHGTLRVDLNLKSYELGENRLIVYVPGNIVRLSVREGDQLPEIIVVAATRELLSDVRLDFAKLFEESITILDNPCISLSESNLNICEKYYQLAQSLLASGLPNVRGAIRSLFSSVFSLLGSLWTSELNRGTTPAVNSSSHSKMVFENFLQLVTRYHNEQRTIGFYANKLCLTPKYLSRLVKEVSGHPANDWINSMVVLEAKNMLKYSELTTKEIALRLNFSSVPGFHKFFKDNAGITPKQWREDG